MFISQYLTLRFRGVHNGHISRVKLKMPDYYVRAILDFKYNELESKVRTPPTA